MHFAVSVFMVLFVIAKVVQMLFQVCFGQKDAGAVGTLVMWVAVMFFRHASNSSIQLSPFI
jgi:hypothetical protein